MHAFNPKFWLAGNLCARKYSGGNVIFHAETGLEWVSTCLPFCNYMSRYRFIFMRTLKHVYRNGFKLVSRSITPCIAIGLYLCYWQHQRFLTRGGNHMFISVVEISFWYCVIDSYYMLVTKNNFKSKHGRWFWYGMCFYLYLHYVNYCLLFLS